MYSRSKKNGDASVLFRPVQTEVKWPSPCTRMETGRAEADAAENAVDYSKHENDASRAKESQEKHGSIQAIAFGGDQSQLATRDRSIINQTQ